VTLSKADYSDTAVSGLAIAAEADPIHFESGNQITLTVNGSPTIYQVFEFDGTAWSLDPSNGDISAGDELAVSFNVVGLSAAT
jgi:hypothetical protein